MFSPRFKSVAEMAGWDEDSLLLASLVVEDTPDRNAKNNKRSPPSTSKRKRKARRRSPVSMSIPVIDLDEDEPTNNNEKGNAKKVECIEIDSAKKVEIDHQGNVEKGTSIASSSSMTLPCVDRLREELSCAICLDICFEPSTTPCGHSFCMKCLKNAADKCGKRCPKCRQLISNGRSCTINTVLWNTIQLLFPVEVEARKAAEPSKSREAEGLMPETKKQIESNSRRLRLVVASRRDGISLNRREEGSRNPETTNQSESNLRVTRRLRPVGSSRRDSISLNRREEGSRNRGRGVATQDEDAALALRLQRPCS